MADFEETLHLVVDFLRKYSYVELAQELELEASHRPAQPTTRQLSRLEGLVRKGLLWERTDDLAWRAHDEEGLPTDMAFGLGAQEQRNMTRSQPTLPIFTLSPEKKEAKEIKRRAALFSCPAPAWEEGRGFSRHSREPHLTLSMPKISEILTDSGSHLKDAGNQLPKHYYKLSASVPVYSTRLFLDNSEDIDDVAPYLKTATPSNSVSLSTSLLKSVSPESDEEDEQSLRGIVDEDEDEDGTEVEDDDAKERSTTQDYIFEMEGVNSLPTTPQQPRKVNVPPYAPTTNLLNPTKTDKSQKIHEKDKLDQQRAQQQLQQCLQQLAEEDQKKEQLKREQEEKQRQEQKLEQDEKLEQEKLREQEKQEQRQVPFTVQPKVLQPAKRKLKLSPRTTDEELDFSEVNLVNNPDESLEYFNLRIIYQRKHTGFEESRDFPIRKGDIIAGRYEIFHFLGSAAFSRAVQCLDKKTNEMVCMKIIKNTKDFYDQCLDEIKLLKYIRANGDPDENHVLNMYDYFYYKEHLFIVCELLRDNLYEFYKYNRSSGPTPYFTFSRLQLIAKQCLSAIEYIHGLNLIHCDLKPENCMYSPSSPISWMPCVS